MLFSSIDKNCTEIKKQTHSKIRVITFKIYPVHNPNLSFLKKYLHKLYC